MAAERVLLCLFVKLGRVDAVLLCKYPVKGARGGKTGLRCDFCNAMFGLIAFL